MFPAHSLTGFTICCSVLETEAKLQWREVSSKFALPESVDSGRFCRCCRDFSYELRGTSDEFRVTSYELRVTSFELRVTSYELRFTSYEFRGTSDDLRVMSGDFWVAICEWGMRSERLEMCRGNVGATISVFADFAGKEWFCCIKFEGRFLQICKP